MRKKTDHAQAAGKVQVFELTMDNSEDQDRLNRRLRKPGEPDRCSPPKSGDAQRSDSTAVLTGKKRGHRKGKL